MPGKANAPKSGNELRDQVIQLASSLGLEAKPEVKAARRLWGAKRSIDVVVTDKNSGKRLGMNVNIKVAPDQQKKKYLPLFKILHFGQFPVLW